MKYLALALAACSSSATPPAGGPVYTPGVHLDLTNLAPDCTITKTASGKSYACVGKHGTIAIQLGAGDRMRHVEIKLISMTLPQAKAHFDPALQKVLGDTAELDARLDKLEVLDRAALELGGAHVSLAALGTNRLMPEYTVTADW